MFSIQNNRENLISIFAVSIMLMAAFKCEGQQDLIIRIDSGIETAIPIAVVPFASLGSKNFFDLTEVIRNDLKRTGQFTPIPVADMPSLPSSLATVNFKDWRVLGIENLLIGQLLDDGESGRLIIEFRLLDVFRGSQLLGFQVPTEPGNLRWSAHYIADLVYEELTGLRGAFGTRIVYVRSEKRDDGTKRYSLQVADSDGYEARGIFESSEPLLSPVWSPDGEAVAYVSFEKKKSTIYVQHLSTGRREEIIASKGLNSSPAWSPDGYRLAFTSSRDGNPEIYVYDFRTKFSQRLTHHSAIDTEASWAPDGTRIAFTSDRGGGPQIYSMTLDSTVPKRVTFNIGNYNSRARFSPDGRNLVLVNGWERGYRLGIFDMEKGSFRAITNGRLDESPSFSPNGVMLIYAATGSVGSELVSLSIDGSVRQQIRLKKGDIREPAWSPFLGVPETQGGK